MLELYRRHSEKCPHYAKGQNYTKCNCPIWAYGVLDGKPIRCGVKLRDWARAVKRVEQWEANPKAALRVTSLAAAIEMYLGDGTARGLRESTLKSYAKTLEHLQSFFGDAGVDEVTLEKLTAFRASRKVAPATSGKELETLRAFCAFASERKWIAENCAKKLKPPKESAPPTLPFSDEEIDKILDACGRLEDDNTPMRELTRLKARARCLVMLYSGLRISDTVQLERRRVDLSTGACLLRIMKTGSPQYVTLGQDALEALRAIPATSLYFFWSGKSKLATAVGNARKSIQRVLKLAGVKGHPHRFRDTFSVGLLERGTDIRTVQMLLGHGSLSTTEKHYAPWVDSFQRRLDAATAGLAFGTRAKALVQNPVQSNQCGAKIVSIRKLSGGS